MVYRSDISIISATSVFSSLIRFLAGWWIISPKLSRPTPPLPMSLLNRRIPIMIFDNSQSYATFSGVVSDTNGLKPALGSTDSRAATNGLRTWARSSSDFASDVAFINWRSDPSRRICRSRFDSAATNLGSVRYSSGRVSPGNQRSASGSSVTISGSAIGPPSP